MRTRDIGIFIMLLALLMIGGGAYSQQVGNTERPKVAVVLSGGGAKGVAHISVLRAIEEAGIPIDIICGTSMGSLIGGLYSIGYSTDMLDSLVRNIDWLTLLSDRTDPKTLNLRQRADQNTYSVIRALSAQQSQSGGIIRGKNLEALFTRICAGYLDSISFDSLPIRFACVATDVVTNSEVVFHNGRLITSMRASMAIPGVFTPVRIGDSVLVDGGLKNNYPADVAREMGADIIIGVSVQNEPLEAKDMTDAVSIFSQLIDINCRNKLEENIRTSNIFISVDVEGYSAASFFPSAIDTLLEHGKQAADEHKEEINNIAKLFSGESPSYPTKRSIEADTITSPSTQPSISQIHNAIVGVGFRVDTKEMAVVQLNAKYPLPTRLPMGLEATLRMGKRFSADVEYSFFPHTSNAMTTRYTFMNQNLDIYDHGKRAYNVRYNSHSFFITPLNVILKRFTIEAGLNYQYYNYYGNILSQQERDLVVENTGYFALYTKIDLNNEDNWYFASRGTRLSVRYAYRTDNLVGYNNGVGISDVAWNFRANISPIERLTIRPMFYGRMLFGEEIPLPYMNAIGGVFEGYEVEQEIPFAAVTNLEYAKQMVVCAGIRLQYRIMNNHYLLFNAVAGEQRESFGDLFRLPDMFALQGGYSYNTIFGPVDVRLGYSNYTSKINFLINIGHHF